MDTPTSLRRALRCQISECLQHPLALVHLYRDPIGTILWQHERITFIELVTKGAAIAVSEDRVTLEELASAAVYLEWIFILSWALECLLWLLWLSFERLLYLVVRGLRDIANLLENQQNAVEHPRWRVLRYRTAAVLVVVFIPIEYITLHFLMPHSNFLGLITVSTLRVCYQTP